MPNTLGTISQVPDNGLLSLRPTRPIGKRVSAQVPGVDGEIPWREGKRADQLVGLGRQVDGR